MGFPRKPLRLVTIDRLTILAAIVSVAVSGAPAMAFAVAGDPVAPPATTSASDTFEVTATEAKIRLQPTIDAPEIARVAQGTVLDVVAEGDGWVRVVVVGDGEIQRVGYVLASLGEIRRAPPPAVSPAAQAPTATGSARPSGGGASHRNSDEFRRAMDIFNSADQPESVALFSNVIDRLEQQARTRVLSGDEARLVAQSYFHRAEVRFNIDKDSPDVAADLLGCMSWIPDPQSLGIDMALVSPKLVDQLTVQRQRIGHILVVSHPTDVSVRVDNVLVPLTGFGIPTIEGIHSVTVEHPSYEPATQRVQVLGGVASSVEFTLRGRTVEFSKVDLFVPDNGERRKRDARLEVNLPERTLTLADERRGVAGGLYARISTDNVIALTYQYSKDPMVPVRIGGIAGLIRGRSHWLLIEAGSIPDYPESFVFLKLDGDNYREILTTLES